MNPFTELLAIINDWTKAGGNTIHTKRGGTDVRVNVDRITRLLLEITDFLRDRPEPLPQQQELLDELWDFMVYPESLWGNMNHPQQDPSTGWRGMLQALTAVWGNESVPVKPLTPTQLQTLCETLIEIHEQFGIVTQMPPDTRRYLADLVDRALACLDRKFTDVRLAHSFVMETSEAVLVIFPDIPANQRSKFSKSISKALSIFGLTGAAGAAGNLISGGITTTAGMIGSRHYPALLSARQWGSSPVDLGMSTGSPTEEEDLSCPLLSRWKSALPSSPVSSGFSPAENSMKTECLTSS